MGNRAIKYRLYPTSEQKALFARTFGCCRKVWNLMLSDKNAFYRETGKLLHNTPAAYKEEYPYLREVDSLALANVQLNLQAAYRNFFRDKKTGFPKFKSAKRSRKAYTTNNQGGTVALRPNGIRLPKVGTVRAVVHRLPEEGWALKSATVSMESDGKYYASVLFEYEQHTEPVSIHTDSAIGLDYKSDGLYMDSRGHVGSSHKYYRESQQKLAKAQRRLSRKQGSRKGEEKSRNYLKQLRKVNRIHRHTANQRLDHLHKLSAEIANQYDIVCVEDLDMKALSNKGFGNGKATLDNGYGMFLGMLHYKLEDRGKHFVRVGRWFPSSQVCCACGAVHPEMKDLNIRTMDCGCGNHMGRDHNAAVNILQEGLRILRSA